MWSFKKNISKQQASINQDTEYIQLQTILDTNIILSRLNGNKDPSCENNYVIKVAIEKGYVNIIDMLIKDRRVKSKLTSKEIEKIQKILKYNNKKKQ